MLHYFAERTRSSHWNEFPLTHTLLLLTFRSQKHLTLGVFWENLCSIRTLWLSHLSAAPAGSSAECLVCVTFLNSAHTWIHTHTDTHTNTVCVWWPPSAAGQRAVPLCLTPSSSWTPTPACGRKTLTPRSKTLCVWVCVFNHLSVFTSVYMCRHQTVSIHLQTFLFVYLHLYLYNKWPGTRQCDLILMRFRDFFCWFLWNLIDCGPTFN